MFRILVGIGSLQIIAVLVNFARAKVAALLVGPEGLGIISIVDQTIQFAAHASTLSLPFATVKFLSKAHGEGEEAFRRGYAFFFNLLWILGTIGALVATSLALFRIDLFPAELSRYTFLLVAGFLGIPGIVLAGFFPNVLAAAQYPNGSARLTVSVGIVVALASTVGLMAGGLTESYIASTVVVSFMACGVMAYLWRALGLSITSPSALLSTGFQHVRKVMSFSALFYTTALTATGSLLVARYAMLKSFGEADAGFLQAGMAIALLMNVVLNPLNGLFLAPQINRPGAKAIKFQTTAEFQKQFLLIATMFALPLLLFPHQILMVAFSSAFLVAAQYVFLFVLWQALANVAGVYQALLIGLDDMVGYAILTCLGHLLTACAVVVLIPHYGLLGAAIGFVTASAFLVVITFVRLRLTHGFTIPANLTWLMGYSLVIMAVVGAFSRNAGEWDAITVVSKLATALLAVAGLLLFLSRKEKLTLSALSQKVWAGSW